MCGRKEPDSGTGTHAADVADGTWLRGGVTHDYRRHGTTTLFAALDTAKGKVLTQCRARHRHQEYLGFLREIEKNVPETLDVHLIVDNYATHKHPRVKRWLAVRPRFHVHCAPTYASWRNQVEIWFNRITQQAIRRGTFRSVKELIEKIDQYVQTSNNHAQPFVWTATADSIFAKVQRLCERISGTGQQVAEKLCFQACAKGATCPERYAPHSLQKIGDLRAWCYNASRHSALNFVSTVALERCVYVTRCLRAALAGNLRELSDGFGVAFFRGHSQQYPSLIAVLLHSSANHIEFCQSYLG